MEKQEKVVDASLVIKWFLREKESDKALRIREDHILGKTILIVPELVFLEVANALRYKKIDIKRIQYINESLWRFQFKVQKIDKFILDKTIENSIKYNITIYDALYITIAQLYGTFLITADKELYKVPNVIALEKV